MNLKNLLFEEEYSIIYDDNEFCISKKKSNTIRTVLVTLFIFVSYSLNYYSYYKLGYNKVLYIIIPVLLSIIAYLVYTIMQLIKSHRNKDIWYGYAEFSSISIEKKKRKRVTVSMKRINNNELSFITEYDRYFLQFINLVKRKGIEIIPK